MKVLTTSLFCLLVLTSCATEKIDQERTKAVASRSPQQSPKSARLIQEAPFRPLSHRITAKLFLKEGKLTASDEVRIQRTTDHWHDVSFHLWRALDIERLVINGNSARFTYGPGEIVRSVVIPQQELPDAQETVQLLVFYAGEPRFDQIGSMHTIISPEIVSLSPTHFPWYPQFDKGVNSAAEITFIVPKEYTVVASGRLKNVCSSGDWNEWTWTTEISGERFSFVIGPYISRSACLDDLPISVHMFAKDEDVMDAVLEEAKRILMFYRKRLGEYPFEKLAIAALPDSIRGGYEEDSFLKIQRSILRRHDVSYGLPHEMAHLWRIRVGGPGRLWIVESLAEYMNHQYFEATKGTECAREIRNTWASKYSRLIANITEFPLAGYTQDMPQECYTLYYNKGPWVWHILRQILGTKVFERLILEFYRQNIFRTITIADFQELCEEVHGMELSWLFQQWLERPGTPVLDLIDVTITRVEDGWLTSGTIRQQQNIYHLPVKIGLQTQQMDVHCLWVQSAQTRFELRTEVRPQAVVLDPDKNLLFR